MKYIRIAHKARATPEFEDNIFVVHMSGMFYLPSTVSETT
jgi:hypothetical protein